MKPLCDEVLSSNLRRCDRPAKYQLDREVWDGNIGEYRKMRVCGVHVRWWRNGGRNEVEELT